MSCTAHKHSTESLSDAVEHVCLRILNENMEHRVSVSTSADIDIHGFSSCEVLFMTRSYVPFAPFPLSIFCVSPSRCLARPPLDA